MSAENIPHAVGVCHVLLGGFLSLVLVIHELSSSWMTSTNDRKPPTEKLAKLATGPGKQCNNYWSLPDHIFDSFLALRKPLNGNSGTVQPTMSTHASGT